MRLTLGDEQINNCHMFMPTILIFVYNFFPWRNYENKMQKPTKDCSRALFMEDYKNSQCVRDCKDHDLYTLN